MRLLAMSLIATGYLCCNAHGIKYTYDDSGNRIKREIVIDHLFVHEYGHYIQAQRMGSMFFPVVGFHSLMSAAFTSHWKGLDHN